MRKSFLLPFVLLAFQVLCVNEICQSQCTLVGWATQNGGVTGGGGATPTVVSNYTALKNALTSSSVKVIHVSGAITIPSAGRINLQDLAGKTIIGLPGSKLISNDLTKDGSGILYVKRCTNMIFRNLTFEGPGAYDTDGWDNMALEASNNIWVDHCEFQDGMDGNLDIKSASDYISVTWCKFIYNKSPIPGGSGGSDDHRFTNLFGSSDSDTGDRGHLRVTLQNCWWAQGCKARMPRVRFGKVHVVNNLFNSTVAAQCVMAGFEADLLVESNVFENVKKPIDLMDGTYTAITSRNNIFTNTSGNTAGSGTAFTPPYSLTITPAANVKAQVTAGAGASLSDPVLCTSTPPTIYTLTTNASPAAGGTVSGAGNYNSGSVVTVTATPAAGYTFTGWSGDASGTSTSVSVTMSSNKAVTANFALATYTLATAASPSAGGTVTAGGTYNAGTVVTVTAIPAAGYSFLGWSGDASGSSTSVSVTMSSNKSVTANFQVTGGGGTNSTIRIEDNATSATGLCSYDGAISANTGGSNGKVINLANGAAKALVWQVSAASFGSYTLNWRYVNSSSGNTFSMKLMVNGTNIDAALPFPQTANSTTFSNATKSVTLNAGSNTIRLESTTSSATADIDWIEITGNAPAAANCLGTVTTYSLTTASSPSAGGTVTGAGTYNSGSVVTVTATPAAGYTFTGWSGDASGTSASVSVTMSSNKAVTANFAPITYALTTTASPSTGGTVTGAGTYNSGSVVTVTATPAAGYTFTGWSGDASGTSTSASVIINSNKAVTANFALITYTLTTTTSPSAGGTVTGAGTYNSGSVVTVTATPAAGYTFTGWSGDASGTSTSASVIINSNKAVTANFALITYTLTTTTSPSAGGTVTGAGTYNSGSVVTVTATPAAGYTFTGWSGDASGTSTSASVTMSSDKAVTANFAPITYTLTTEASPSAGGTVTDAGTYNSGSVVTVTATPAAGYTFTGWSGDASGTSTSASVTMSSDKAVTAIFVPITYTLTTTASPSAGGTVTGAGTYNAGTVVTVTATPAAGYTFTGWSGDASGTSTSASVTMSSDKAVTAIFAPITYTLTTSASPSAGGTVTGAGTYNAGTVVTVTATPAAGYTFTGWSGDASGASTSVSVAMSSDKSVTASFAPITYTLTTAASPSAGGTVTGAGTYNSGSVVTVSVTPAAGYTFTGWSGDATGTSNSVAVTMSSNKAITANFTPIIYTLTTTASPLTGGTVTGAGTYNSGSVVTVTATPAAGYAFSGWSGDATGTSTSASVTMTSNKSATANFVPSYTTSTLRIEDNATSSTGLCLYEGSISSNTGANNGNVINLGNSAGKGVNWMVNTPAAGSYSLKWRYVNSSSGNTFSMKLIVNGVILNSALPFPKTSSSTVFANTTAAVNLQAGNNSIRLESTTSSATADIDWIEITGTNPGAGNCGAALITAAPTDANGNNIFPNPVKNGMTIVFMMPEAGKANVSILDAFGRTTDNLGNNYFTKGMQQLSYRMKTIGGGKYYISIITEKGVKKLIPFISTK